MTDDPHEQHRLEQRIQIWLRDSEMSSEIRRRIIDGRIPEEQLQLAWLVSDALSHPPLQILGRPAKEAIRECKQRNINPRQFGASWNALKRALAYEDSQPSLAERGC